MPKWLIIVSSISVGLGLITAAVVAIDVTRHRQRMKIMSVVWPVTGLYFPVIGWRLYAAGFDDRVLAHDADRHAARLCDDLSRQLAAGKERHQAGDVTCQSASGLRRAADLDAVEWALEDRRSAEASSVRSLAPELSVLPASQLELWNRLASTPADFVLYGGTALALRLGHRTSVDFDFFSARSFQPAELVREIDYLSNQRVTQEGESTLSCEIDAGADVVKISFFGGLSVRQIQPPDTVVTNGVAVASLKDLFGMKCATVPQRNEAKDYLDIHALIYRGRIGLPEGIACAAAIYGRRYNPVMTLQALTYFDDLPEPLPRHVTIDLRAAVEAVSLRDLPVIEASQRIGDGIERP